MTTKPRAVTLDGAPGVTVTPTPLPAAAGGSAVVDPAPPLATPPAGTAAAPATTPPATTPPATTLPATTLPAGTAGSAAGGAPAGGASALTEPDAPPARVPDILLRAAEMEVRAYATAARTLDAKAAKARAALQDLKDAGADEEQIRAILTMSRVRLRQLGGPLQ